MLLYIKGDIEIAEGAAPGARLALAADANLLIAIHTGGHLYDQTMVLAYPALAATLAAGDGDHRAAAPAGVAGSHRHHVKEGSALAHLAATTALGAAHRIGTRLGTAALAAWAPLKATELDLLLAAEDRLLKRQTQVVTQVGTALGAALSALTTTAARSAKEGIEDRTEGIPTAEWIVPRAAAAGRAVAKAVVHRPLLLIGQHLVRLVDFLELGLGAVLSIHIGVVLASQATVCLLDLIW